MRRQKLIHPQTRAQAPKPSKTFTSMIDDRYSRPEIWRVTINSLHRPQFPNITHRTLPAWHENTARTMQIVPLRLVLPITIEYLDPMIFPVRDINPPIGIASN